MTYQNTNIETNCDVEQRWEITSPQVPGAKHVITSTIVGLPSERARIYAADMADKVRELKDWGGSGP